MYSVDIIDAHPETPAGTYIWRERPGPATTVTRYAWKRMYRVGNVLVTEWVEENPITTNWSNSNG